MLCILTSKNSLDSQMHFTLIYKVEFSNEIKYLNTDKQPISAINVSVYDI